MKNYSRTFSGIPCRPMLRCAWIWFIRVFFATVKLFRVLSVGSSLFYCVAWVFGLSIKHEAGISNIQYSQHFPYFVILYITIASPPLPRRRSPMTGCPGWVPPARLRPSSFRPDFLAIPLLIGTLHWPWRAVRRWRRTWTEAGKWRAWCCRWCESQRSHTEPRAVYSQTPSTNAAFSLPLQQQCNFMSTFFIEALETRLRFQKQFNLCNLIHI